MRAKKMMARYAGDCTECGEDFPAGTWIAWIRGGYTAHAECYDRVREVEDATLDDRRGADPELIQAEREQARMDAEYAAGQADADRYRFDRDMFGEDYAAAEDLAWSMRTGEGW